jgi:hypothetical protein
MEGEDRMQLAEKDWAAPHQKFCPANNPALRRLLRNRPRQNL